MIPERAYANTFEYRYNKRAVGLRHCSACGVIVFMVVYGPPNLEEMLNQLKERNPERYEAGKKIADQNMSLLPLNVRTLENLDWEKIQQVVKRNDEGTEGYVLDD